MKIFLCGNPGSGRTTIAKALAQDTKYQYIDASSWIKETFRDQKDGEHIQQYLESYQEYLTKRIQANPLFAINNILDSIKAYKNNENIFIIDGVNNPKDFIHLFDVNEDVVVFLNRTDNAEEFKDSENIAVSVIRDYCYWMSITNLLPKSRWIEINFKIPGDPNDNSVKFLGNKNSIYLVKNFKKVISVVRDLLQHHSN